MKRFFAVLLLFGFICAMGVNTIGCSKKEDKKPAAPVTPPADKAADKKDDKKP